MPASKLEQIAAQRQQFIKAGKRVPDALEAEYRLLKSKSPSESPSPGRSFQEAASPTPAPRTRVLAHHQRHVSAQGLGIQMAPRAGPSGTQGQSQHGRSKSTTDKSMSVSTRGSPFQNTINEIIDDTLRDEPSPRMTRSRTKSLITSPPRVPSGSARSTAPPNPFQSTPPNLPPPPPPVTPSRPHKTPNPPTTRVTRSAAQKAVQQTNEWITAEDLEVFNPETPSKITKGPTSVTQGAQYLEKVLKTFNPAKGMELLTRKLQKLEPGEQRKEGYMKVYSMLVTLADSTGNGLVTLAKIMEQDTETKELAPDDYDLVMREADKIGKEILKGSSKTIADMRRFQNNIIKAWGEEVAKALVPRGSALQNYLRYVSPWAGHSVPLERAVEWVNYAMCCRLTERHYTSLPSPYPVSEDWKKAYQATATYGPDPRKSGKAPGNVDTRKIYTMSDHGKMALNAAAREAVEVFKKKKNFTRDSLGFLTDRKYIPIDQQTPPSGRVETIDPASPPKKNRPFGAGSSKKSKSKRKASRSVSAEQSPSRQRRESQDLDDLDVVAFLNDYAECLNDEFDRQIAYDEEYHCECSAGVESDLKESLDNLNFSKGYDALVTLSQTSAGGWPCTMHLRDLCVAVGIKTGSATTREEIGNILLKIIKDIPNDPFRWMKKLEVREHLLVQSRNINDVDLGGFKYFEGDPEWELQHCCWSEQDQKRLEKELIGDSDQGTHGVTNAFSIWDGCSGANLTRLQWALKKDIWCHQYHTKSFNGELPRDGYHPLMTFTLFAQLVRQHPLLWLRAAVSSKTRRYSFISYPEPVQFIDGSAPLRGVPYLPEERGRALCQGYGRTIINYKVPLHDEKEAGWTRRTYNGIPAKEKEIFGGHTRRSKSNKLSVVFEDQMAGSFGLTRSNMKPVASGTVIASRPTIPWGYGKEKESTRQVYANAVFIRIEGDGKLELPHVEYEEIRKANLEIRPPAESYGGGRFDFAELFDKHRTDSLISGICPVSDALIGKKDWNDPLVVADADNWFMASKGKRGDLIREW